MPALVIYGLLAVLVAALVVGLLIIVLPDDTLAPPIRDTVPAGLPPRSEIGADDVTRLRLPVALRGYRMVDTDAVLDRLGAELERRDREIAALRVSLDAPAADLGAADAVVPAHALVPVDVVVPPDTSMAADRAPEAPPQVGEPDEEEPVADERLREEEVS